MKTQFNLFPSNSNQFPGYIYKIYKNIKYTYHPYGTIAREPIAMVVLRAETVT